MKLRRPKRNEDILAAWYELMAYLRSESVQPGYGIRISQTAGGKALSVDPSIFTADFPFRIKRYAENSIEVVGGKFVRNATIFTLANTVLTAAAATPYVHLHLDVEHNPGSCEIVLDAAENGTVGPDEWPSNVWFCLGKVTSDDTTISAIEQWWWGGHIDDRATTPDSRTIEHCPNEGMNAGYRKLQLFDYDTLTQVQPHLPYVMGNGGLPPELLAWLVPDANVVNTLSKSIETGTGTGEMWTGLTLELHEWTNTNSTQMASLSDLLCFKQVGVTGNILYYVSAADVWPFIEGGGGPDGWHDGIQHHHGDLDERDIDNPDGHPTLYWLMGGDYTRCYGSSIGLSAVVPAIDLTNLSLTRGASGNLVVFDWDEGLLYDVQATPKLSIDLDVRSLMAEDGTTTALEWGSTTGAYSGILTGGWKCDGNFEVTAGYGYIHATHAGATFASDDLYLVQEDGTHVGPVRLRGGILCVD